MESDLKRVNGTRDVVTLGGPRRSVRVELDPARMNANGVTVADLRRALRAPLDREQAPGIRRGLLDTGRQLLALAPAMLEIRGFLAGCFGLGLGPRGVWWGYVGSLVVVALLQGGRLRWRFQQDIKRLHLDETQEHEIVARD